MSRAYRPFWRWWLACLLAVAAPALAQPARLLFVAEAVGTTPWHALFLDSLRLALRERHPDLELDVETFSRSVGTSPRSGVPPDWLLQKYDGRHYDIVLAGDAEYVSTLVQLRDRLWPQATVMSLMANETLRTALRGIPRTLALTPSDSVPETLALIFRLRPGTRHVAVIASTLDNDPLRDWRSSLAALDGRADLIDLSGLPLEALRERMPALPPDSAVYFALPALAIGRVASARDLFDGLVALSNAPVFVDSSLGLGSGAIGGAVTSPEGMARDVARQVKALLDGTPPERIGFVPHSPAQAMFDWRALQRWNISMQRLPAGSVVLEQPPGLWTAYRPQVLAGGGVVAIQVTLIAALLFERTRRRRAELQAREHLANLARMNRAAALGVLSAALAHEINQPLGAILGNAETAELLLDSPDGAPREALRELLAAIREDDQRAAAVLQRLRAWIADAPEQVQPAALNTLASEAARLLATELRLRDTELQLSLAPALPQVMVDCVQVQQVILNLVLNALDALQAVPARQRRIVLTTALHGDREVELTVCDNGPGFGGVAPERLFEPFFSTKPQGLGVGLAISRSIVERHGGHLRASDAPGGVRFDFTLPIARATVVPHPRAV